MNNNMIAAVTPVFTPVTLTPSTTAGFDWGNLINTLVNSGLSVYQATQAAAAQKKAAEAAAAAGKNFTISSSNISSNSFMEYLPYIAIGAALLVTIMVLKKK